MSYVPKSSQNFPPPVNQLHSGNRISDLLPGCKYNDELSSLSSSSEEDVSFETMQRYRLMYFEDPKDDTRPSLPRSPSINQSISSLSGLVSQFSINKNDSLSSEELVSESDCSDNNDDDRSNHDKETSKEEIFDITSSLSDESSCHEPIEESTQDEIIFDLIDQEKRLFNSSYNLPALVKDDLKFSIDYTIRQHKKIDQKIDHKREILKDDLPSYLLKDPFKTSKSLKIYSVNLFSIKSVTKYNTIINTWSAYLKTRKHEEAEYLKKRKRYEIINGLYKKMDVYPIEVPNSEKLTEFERKCKLQLLQECYVFNILHEHRMLINFVLDNPRANLRDVYKRLSKLEKEINKFKNRVQKVKKPKNNVKINSQELNINSEDLLPYDSILDEYLGEVGDEEVKTTEKEKESIKAGSRVETIGLSGSNLPNATSTNLDSEKNKAVSWLEDQEKSKEASSIGAQLEKEATSLSNPENFGSIGSETSSELSNLFKLYGTNSNEGSIVSESSSGLASFLRLYNSNDGSIKSETSGDLSDLLRLYGINSSEGSIKSEASIELSSLLRLYGLSSNDESIRSEASREFSSLLRLYGIETGDEASVISENSDSHGIKTSKRKKLSGFFNSLKVKNKKAFKALKLHKKPEENIEPKTNLEEQDFDGMKIPEKKSRSFQVEDVKNRIKEKRKHLSQSLKSLTKRISFANGLREKDKFCGSITSETADILNGAGLIPAESIATSSVRDNDIEKSKWLPISDEFSRISNFCSRYRDVKIKNLFLGGS